jgi:hypothetical protein
VKGKKRVDVMGNYMGYMDFNGVRYLDTREVDSYYFPIVLTDQNEILGSDSRKRLDARVLEQGDVVAAQAAKE